MHENHHHVNVTAFGEKESLKQQQELLEESKRHLNGEQQFRALGSLEWKIFKRNIHSF